MSENEGLTSDLSQAIAAKLIELMQEMFDDEEAIFDIVKPIIPALVGLGIQEGIEAAETALAGLGEEDTYSAWETIIRASSPETRIDIMKRTQQMAIEDKIKKLASEKARWDVLKLSLRIAVSMLALLLV